MKRGTSLLLKQLLETPTRFLSGGTISRAQEKWNRSVTWNVPVKYYFSHIFLKSTMSWGERQYFVIRLKHFSDTFFSLLTIYSLSLMISNCRQNHCFREILESPLLGGHSKWSYSAMVLRHLFDSDYLCSFLSPILSHYAIIPWGRL